MDMVRKMRRPVMHTVSSTKHEQEYVVKEQSGMSVALMSSRGDRTEAARQGRGRSTGGADGHCAKDEQTLRCAQSAAQSLSM